MKKGKNKTRKEEKKEVKRKEKKLKNEENKEAIRVTKVKIRGNERSRNVGSQSSEFSACGVAEEEESNLDSYFDSFSSSSLEVAVKHGDDVVV